MRKVFVLILLLVFAQSSNVLAKKNSMYTAIKPACVSPKPGPIQIKESQSDKYIDKFASKIAPSIIGNIIGGPTGIALKVASKVDEKANEKENTKQQ